jgi:FixJ family two-component response regulator
MESKDISEGLLVAIVDDDASVRRSLKRFLRGQGFRVAEYESGELFLSEADLSLPECVILDVHLRGMSGPDVKRKLDSRGEQIRVIFITAHEAGGPDLMEDMKGIPCLHKPFSGSSLLELIRGRI